MAVLPQFDDARAMRNGSARPSASNPDSQTGLRGLGDHNAGNVAASSSKSATDRSAMGPVRRSNGATHGEDEETNEQELEETSG